MSSRHRKGVVIDGWILDVSPQMKKPSAGYRISLPKGRIREFYPRSEIVIGSEGDLMERLIDALRTTKSDWRTPGSLAKQIGADPMEVSELLYILGKEGVVRHPFRASEDELDYYRATDRRMTWQETVRRIRLALERTPVAGANVLD